MKNIGIIGLLAVTLSMSCSDIEEPKTTAEENGKSISFFQQIDTKANDWFFESKDCISVFVIDENANGLLKASGNHTDNSKYQYSKSMFSKTDNNGIVQLSDNANLKYFAVYPYSTSVSNSYTFEVKSDQRSWENYKISDLMTAVTEFTTDTVVPLVFSHKLARVYADFYGTFYKGDQAVTLTAFKRSCTVNLNDNSVTATGSAGKISMYNTRTSEFVAIVPPQTVAKGTTLCTIYIGDNSFPFVPNVDYDIVLQPGKNYLLQANFTVTKAHDAFTMSFKELPGDF